jgi:hypothetical protein
MDKPFANIYFFGINFWYFQAELDSVPLFLELPDQLEHWNPIRINFQHLSLLISDAWRANGKINSLFGLNQQDGVENFEEKYPVNKIKYVYNFENTVHNILTN